MGGGGVERHGDRSRVELVLGPAQVGGDYGIDKVSRAGHQAVEGREHTCQVCAGVRLWSVHVLKVTAVVTVVLGGVQYCRAEMREMPVVV